tara:strand:- start:21 stop:668 length:648 start_codon:yes stop_codon:yes gene_type:complete
MLLKKELKEYMHMNNISINGILHIGAHECEELEYYTNELKVNDNNIIWIDAIEEKVKKNKTKNIKNVHHALITDVDDKQYNFNISNNYQSSSIFELGTHKYRHPEVRYIKQIHLQSITIDTFLKKHNYNPALYELWNFDIQGAELLALKGGETCLKHVKILYLEVSNEELYKNCNLITEIDEYLNQNGFFRVITKILPYQWGDAIYLNTNYQNYH